MIKSFRDKETEKVFHRIFSRKFPSHVQDAALRRLVAVHAAERLEDLTKPPGNRLEKLKGVRVGQYSIRVSDQFRICFCWRDGDAYEVELVDYH